MELCSMSFTLRFAYTVDASGEERCLSSVEAQVTEYLRRIVVDGIRTRPASES